jgi:hypothetical protein
VNWSAARVGPAVYPYLQGPFGFAAKEKPAPRSNTTAPSGPWASGNVWEEPPSTAASEPGDGGVSLADASSIVAGAVAPSGPAGGGAAESRAQATSGAKATMQSATARVALDIEGQSSPRGASDQRSRPRWRPLLHFS